MCHTNMWIIYCNNIFSSSKEKLIEEYHSKTVSLAGDGRCDSPGNSAKYCTYTLLDIDSGTIVHMETVDKREVSLHSPNMEREAVSRAIKYLHENEITINEIVTDASSAVRKMLGELCNIVANIVYIMGLLCMQLKITRASTTQWTSGTKPRN